MSINLTCECGKKLRVNEDKIGKRVKCPGCQAILSVPAPEAEDEPEPPRKPKQAPPPPEPEDEPEPPRKTKANPAPVDEDEEVIEKPAKKKKSAPIDEEEEKPSKDKKSAASSFGKIIVILGVGAFVLVGGGAAVLGALWYFDSLPFGNRPTNAAKGLPKGTGPDNKGEKPDIIEPKVRFTADLGKEGDARRSPTSCCHATADGRPSAMAASRRKSGTSPPNRKRCTISTALLAQCPPTASA